MHTRARAPKLRCQRTLGRPNARRAPFFSENKRRCRWYPTPMPDLLARVCVRGACDSPGSTHRRPAVVTAERVGTKKQKPCFSFFSENILFISKTTATCARQGYNRMQRGCGMGPGRPSFGWLRERVVFSAATNECIRNRP